MTPVPYLRLVKPDEPHPALDFMSPDIGPTDPAAFQTAVFANHKRNLSGWLRNHALTRRAQGKPVELNYRLCLELADLLDGSAEGNIA